MYGVLGDLVGCLRSVLVSRPNTPGTQFYWRTARGTYATVSVPAALGGATVAAAPLSPVDVAPTDHPHRTSRVTVSMQSSSAVASIDGDPSASLLSSPDETGLTTSVDAAPADHHVDVSPATPHAIGSDGSASIAPAWDDEGALLRAIASEHSSFSTTSALLPSAALLQGDDDLTDVRPPLASNSTTFSPADSRFAPLAPLSPDSASSTPARAATTAALVEDLMPATAPLPVRSETLLVWNAAGWWSGDREGGSDEHQATAALRYDVLDPLLRGRDAPTYVVLNEVSGSLHDSAHPRGLRAWLSAAGYGHHFYPGGSSTRRRTDGSASATGGLLLAWLLSETSACGPPHFDPKSMTIALDFRHRQSAIDAPPMRLIAAYGSHLRNGKRHALRSIVRHVMLTRGCIAAGDLNVVPGPQWKCHARRATSDDDEFAAITGGGELPDAGTSMVSIVDLGLHHAHGQFTRAHWTARLADGSPKGTATLDHVLTAGLERGSWRRRAAWFAFDGAHRLVSDHMLIVVERAPRTVVTDDRGVHRPPRFLVDRWTERQRSAFVASFDTGLQQLRANQWRAQPEAERQSLASGAAAIVQLVALLNAAALAAEDAVQGDPQGDRLRRVHGGGGGIKGVRAQLKRQQGILRVVRMARTAVEHATSALVALRPDALAHSRLRAEFHLQRAITLERELYTPTSASYIARHDRNLHCAIARPYSGLPAQAATTRAFVVVSRLQRDIAYYSQQVRKLERRADRPIWQGIANAMAGGGRDAIVAAMRRPVQHDGAHGGIRGLFRGDLPTCVRDGVQVPGEWISEPAAVRVEAGAIYRRIDDANYGAGTVEARVLGFHEALCQPRWPELAGRDGAPWRLPTECNYDDFCALLKRMHSNKATSLDRISKEMLELLPEGLRRPFYVAAMEIATPDARGARHKPLYWARVPVKLLDKKTPSLCVSKKRDIGLPSQLLKLQAGLYTPAYASVMDRLPGNFGWTPGVAARGAALCGSLALDHAHLLSHLLIVIYADIQRFFPSMDRGFVLLSEQWRGLPRDVRDATLALYHDACFLYETEHGLAEGVALPERGLSGADFEFTTVQSRCGYFQGCLLSTEKAKIFMSSLSEAIDTMIGGGGVRFWNGASGGGRRYPSVLCADDLLGSVTSWKAGAVFFQILSEWAGVSASHFGISDDASKTTFSAVVIDGSGVPHEAPAPPEFLAAAVIGGRAVPRLAYDATYGHVGDPRKLQGDQSPARGKAVGLCTAWLKRIEQMCRCSPREFERATGVGLASIIDAYAPFGPLTFAAAEALEKIRRSIYKRRFRGTVSAACADRYLPDVWHAAPQYGLLTSGLPEARRVGDGWMHCASLNAASVHAAISSAISDGIDSQLRFCARALLSLTCFLWGSFGRHPAAWSWGHLEHLLANPDPATGSSPVGRIFATEVYMKNVAVLRRLAALSDEALAPTLNFTMEHVPPAGDPFDYSAPIYSSLSNDGLRLFEGELISEATCFQLGRRRRPVWLLLSAGIIVRSHVCCDDGSDYMTFDAAVQVVPAFLRRTGSALLASRRAWDQLVADLRDLEIDPVPREAVVDAQTVWRGTALPVSGGPDGTAATGPRTDLDGLLHRMANGDVAAASEWADAYRTWAAAPPPPRVARPLPSPTTDELQGPHTRYRVPGRGGEIDIVTRGKPAPACSVSDAEELARFRTQRWRLAPDGRSFTCALGTPIRQASVIVQLYAAALPIALAAFDDAQAAKAARRLKANEKRNLAGLEPLPPDTPTAEERSWRGGPGFCVQLANLTLDEMLEDEQRQGFAYTAAVAGDGSWDPRSKRISRAALLHDGTRLGGALANDDLVGGIRDNYDAELAHRVDALAILDGRRVLYIFDSTSPILAGEHFRRLSLPARSRMLCNDWLAWAMAHEQRLETVTYWWSHSHCGHLPEAAVDALAKSFLSRDPTPLPRPCEPPRHRSLRHYAKGSERDLMLHVYNLHVVRTQYTAPTSVYAQAGCIEFLRLAQLNDQQRSMVMAIRDDRIRLLGSRVFRNTGPHSIRAILDQRGCPCGKGRQTVEHVMWECELASVASRRTALLVPACAALGAALDACEPVSRDHAISSIARRALALGRHPDAYNTITGAGTPTRITREEARSAALAHVLGVIREPLSWFRPTAQLARPLLRASLALIAAAIHASAPTLRAAAIASRRRTVLHRALQHVRHYTWTHLKPAGLPCRCCALPGSPIPGVHVCRSRRPIDGVRARQAIQQREGVRANGPPQLASLRTFVLRVEHEAQQESRAAYADSFQLLQATVPLDDAVAATLARAEAAGAYAGALEASDLQSAQARAEADRALAAHRAAVIDAANAWRRSRAADATYWDRSTRAHLISIFAGWAAQTVSGLIREGQRAAVRAHMALKAAAASVRTSSTPPSLTPAERRDLAVRRKRRLRDDAAAVTAIQCAQRERAHLLAMRRLAACPGAADTVERARLAARARRATVVGLDDQVRDSRRVAGMASHDTLRVAHEEAQRKEQEFLERSRAAARAWRASALARRRGTRAEYERRVQLLLTGVTPLRRSRIRAAAAEAAANSGPIGTTGIHLGEAGHQSGADAGLALSLPPSSAD